MDSLAHHQKSLSRALGIAELDAASLKHLLLQCAFVADEPGIDRRQSIALANTLAENHKESKKINAQSDPDKIGIHWKQRPRLDTALGGLFPDIERTGLLCHTGQAGE